MNDKYDDIYERIEEPPTWYDVSGCPRWGEPTVPKHLMGRIRCQECGREFLVSLATPVYGISFEESMVPGNVIQTGRPFDEERNDLALDPHWHYGDPPYHDECAAGSTMNSIPEWEWDSWDDKENRWGRK